MTDLNQWLADAATVTGREISSSTLGTLDARLSAELQVQLISTRRDARRMMTCAGVAALLGFTVTGVSGVSGVSGAFAKSSPTWVAAPSASSPFALLIGN
jgi:nickel and cobalt resistance protein CnrY